MIIIVKNNKIFYDFIFNNKNKYFQQYLTINI